MKKALLSISILTVYFFEAKAQECELGYNEILFLKSQTIKVVLKDVDDSLHYNDAIKDALEKYWTFCKYEFITLKEYKTKGVYDNSSALFLVPFRITGNCVIDCIGIVQYHKILYRGFNSFYIYHEPMLNARAPYVSDKLYPGINLGFYIGENKDLIKMLPNIIQQWQWENETTIANPELAEKKPEEVKDFLASQHDLKQLKVATLLIDENSFSKLTSEKIAEVYKYKFKLVAPEEILKAIADQDENICYLYNGGKACDCSYPITVYMAKGGYRIYAPKDYHQVSMYGGGQASFSEKYLEELMAAIDK